MPIKLSFTRSLIVRMLAGSMFASAALTTSGLAARSVTLAWDRNAETDIAGYRVKYGTSSRNYDKTLEAGNVTTATVPDLPEGATYYFTVTAVNTVALESGVSNEVSLVIAANQSPTVSLTSPLTGTSIVAPGQVTLAASAADSDGTIARVEFYNGTTKVGEDTSSPYSYVFNVADAGTYTFTARAFDNQGASATSAAALVTVTSPPTGQPGQGVTLAWDQNTEPDIAGYRLKYGTATGKYDQTLNVGNVTSATVPNLAAGTTYYFAVSAVNTSGLESAMSNEVTLGIAANQAPTVSLTSPANGTSLVAPARVTLAATATDSDGTIARVEFYNGTTKVGEDTSSPYSYALDIANAGAYAFTARAFDDQGASATSATVALTVTVAPPAPDPVQGGKATVKFDPATGATLSFEGTPGSTQTVNVSSDMKNWTVLSSGVSSTGTLTVNDPDAVNFTQRFYTVSDGTNTSKPVGFTKTRMAGISGSATYADSYIGINLVNSASYEGTVSSLASNALVDQQAPWTDDQFNGSNGQHYLEIVSGPYAGLTTDILGTSAGTKTLTTDDDISAVLTGGEKYLIRKHRTIGDIFGADNSAGLKQGTGSTSADVIRLFNPLKQTYTAYYYNTGANGWRSSASTKVDASGTVLYLDQGICIRRRSTGDLTLVVTGEVKLGQTMVAIGSKLNLCANMYPAGKLTLANAGLYNADGSALAGSNSVTYADEVRIWNGKAFVRYYYKTGGTGGTGWRSTASRSVDASAVELPVGSSSYVVRKNLRPAFYWKMPQPF